MARHQVSDDVEIEEKNYGAIIRRERPGDDEEIRLCEHEIRDIADMLVG